LPSSDDETGNAASRNSFLRLFEIDLGVAVTVWVLGAGRGGDRDRRWRRRVRLVELADRTVMVDMVVGPVFGPWL
jgi:hypothetical protein